MDVLKALSVGARAREIDGVGENRLAGGKPEGAAEPDFASRVLELRQERANRKEAGPEKSDRVNKHARRDSAQEEMSAHGGVAEIAALEAAPLTDGAEIASPSGDAVDSPVDVVPASPDDASLANVVGSGLLDDEGNVVPDNAESIDLLAEETAAPIVIKGDAADLKADRNAAPLASKITPATGDAPPARGAAEAARPAPAASQAAAPPPDGEAPVDDAPPLERASSALKLATDAAVQFSPAAPQAAPPASNTGASTSVAGAELSLETAELDTAAPEGLIVEGEAPAGAPKKEALVVTPGGVKLALDAQATPLAPSERPLQAETTLQAESAKPQAPLAQAKVDAQDAARQIFASIRADKGGGVDLRLDPPDLGRVRIQFSFERSDIVVATVSSERGETLDLMRRHANDLARELQRAGFDSVTLEFASNENKQPHPRELPRGGVYDFHGDAIDAPSIVYISARADNRLDRLV